MLNDEALQMIAAEAEQADWSEAIRAAFTNPTIASLIELQSFPQRVEKIETSWNAYRDDQRTRNVTQAAQLASMLNAGKVDFAEKMLVERAHALRKGTKMNSALGNTRDRHPPEPAAYWCGMFDPNGLRRIAATPSRLQAVASAIG